MCLLSRGPFMRRASRLRFQVRAATSFLGATHHLWMWNECEAFAASFGFYHVLFAAQACSWRFLQNQPLFVRRRSILRNQTATFSHCISKDGVPSQTSN